MNEIILRYEPGNEWLAHHGILGQKWGVRRFQNADGSLTSAGKKRYGIGETKQKNKDSDSGETSKHVKSLEEHYKKRGFTEEEARINAINRAKVEKALLVVGGVAAVSAAAYVGYKNKDLFLDKKIKMDTPMYRISPTDTAGVHDAFYAAFSKKDANTYKGLYGKQIMDSQGSQRRDAKFKRKMAQRFNDRIEEWNKAFPNEQKQKRPIPEMPGVFQKTFKTTGTMRVASDRNAYKIFKDTFKDPKELSAFIGDRQRIGKQGEVLKRGREDLDRGKITPNVYKAFNYSLGGGNLRTSTAQQYIQALRDKGYSGIGDLNDRKFSGYNTRTATILFDAANVKNVSVKRLSDEDINNTANIVRQNLKRSKTMKEAVKNTATISGSSAVAGLLATKSVNANNDKIVRQYRSEHPNSKLTYKEIVNNYYNKG